MVNRKLALLLTVSVASLGLAACNTIAVKTDSAPGASLASCRTYAFAYEHVANSDQPAAYANPLNAERLRVAVQNNLAARGIQPAADRKSADCVVGYALGTRQVFDDYYAGWGWGFGYRRGPWGVGGYGYDGPWVQNETRIAVDFFDAKTKKPLWHASASQTVYELSGPNAEAKINAAAAAIFAKLPAVGGTAT
ncbi:MAG TPA: DUF4136 domain-containing protein [Steroidobacteraceae bacterium]|jgi:hypothetical protein